MKGLNLKILKSGELIVDTKNMFIKKIKEKGNDLSPKQIQLVDYIVNNYKKAAFQNLTQIAKIAEVSEATVVRLANSLGYTGFAEMSEDLQKMVQHELSTLERFKNTIKKDNLNIIERIINNDQRNMDKLLKAITMEEIKKAADLIEKSNQLIVAGFYHSTFLAEFLGYSLGKIKKNVSILSRNNLDAHNLFLSSNENTTVILFSFPRYPKSIQQLGKMFGKNGADIIGITDSIMSPLKSVTQQLLVVPLQYISFTDHCSSVMSLSQAIIMEYASRNPQTNEEYAKNFDEYVNMTEIF